MYVGATRLDVSFCWWKMTSGCRAGPKIDFFMDFDEWRLDQIVLDLRPATTREPAPAGSLANLVLAMEKNSQISIFASYITCKYINVSNICYISMKEYIIETKREKKMLSHLCMYVYAHCRPKGKRWAKNRGKRIIAPRPKRYFCKIKITMLSLHLVQIVGAHKHQCIHFWDRHFLAERRCCTGNLFVGAAHVRRPG